MIFFQILEWLAVEMSGGEKKKQTILDLSKYMDKHIHVKFQGGREASGILKGSPFSQLLGIMQIRQARC